MSSFPLRRCLSVAAACLLAVSAVHGQEFQLPSLDQVRSVQASAADDDGPVVKVTAVIAAPAEGQPPRLYVTADIQKGWHIYSITQAKGGPIASKIKLPESPRFRVLGDFKPVPAPAVHMYPDVYGNLPVEEHEGRVTWHAPLEINPRMDLPAIKIDGKLSVQACNDARCLPPRDYPFVAALGPAPQLPAQQAAHEGSGEANSNTTAAAGTYQNPRSHAQISGHLNSGTAAPGGSFQLALTATPAKDWHIYAHAEKAPPTGSKPTLIVFTELPPGWKASAPRASAEPIRKSSGLEGFELPYYEGPVTWTVDVAVPKDATAGEYRLAGLMGYQTCWSSGCDLPTAARFEATVRVGAEGRGGVVPLAFSDARYVEAAKIAAANPSEEDDDDNKAVAGFDPTQLKPTDAQGGSNNASLPLMMLFGFLGGLILNLMPCVLPVIGLKILSFVEQAGQERGRVLWLNIWYSLGLLSVFMVLASLAVFLGMGWGQQFSSSTFNVVLAGVVFAMALSFLGVWEIPIPGFVGSGRANELASREGVSGAFAKGMITTVLATPCTGPFLGTSLAWAVRQPPGITYALFACVGLGMASPYLMLGAFPSLVRFLPRPGAWMETFKQLMGFVLLGTVVFLLTFIEWPLVVPTVALLFGTWLACWWIGRTPLTAELAVKTRAWMTAVTLVGASGLVAFNWLSPVMQERFVARVDKAIGDRMGSNGQVAAGATKDAEAEGHRLPWQPFSKQALAELTSQNRTVLVDFTADWCLVCKSLEKLVLNTEPVKNVVDTHQVVPLMADWTNGDEEVTAMLEALGSKQVPVLAIFPAGRPNEPIVFRDPYTRQQLIDALNKAGPSLQAGAAVSLGSQAAATVRQ